MSIIKAIMSTDPAERQWYEDQFTVNAHARLKLQGNASTVVLLADGLVDSSCSTSEWDSLSKDDAIMAKLHALPGFRLLDGRVLYTARDNARPYKVAKSV